jgi:hypothetical protein
MPAIAAMTKLSMQSCRCAYRAHGALLQVETNNSLPANNVSASETAFHKRINKPRQFRGPGTDKRSGNSQHRGHGFSQVRVVGLFNVFCRNIIGQ